MTLAAAAVLAFLAPYAVVTPCVIHAPRSHWPPTPNSSGRFVTADLDGDGHMDFLASEAILYGRGDGTLESIDFARASPPGHIADVTGDGRPDILREKQAGISLYVNLGGRRFADPVIIHEQATIVATGDFTGDGFVDVLLYGRSILLLVNDGHAKFPTQLVRNMFLNPRETVRAGDVDGDGALDVVASTEDGYRILLSKRNGAFTTVLRFAAWSEGEPLVTDLDGDGRADVVTIGASRESIDIRYGAAIGNTVSIALPEAIEHAYWGPPFSARFAAGDYDGDGQLDLALGTMESVRVLLHRGGETFEEASRIFLLGFSIQSADFNEDGFTDLVFNGPAVVLAKGDGTFQLPRRVPGIGASRFVDVADLNGDGIDELFVGGPSGEGEFPVQVAWMTDSGAYHADTLFRRDRWPAIAAGDVLAFPGKEVIAADGSRLRIYRAGGPADISEAATHDLGATVSAVTAADFTGDSRDEIAAVTTEAGGESSLRIMSGTGELLSLTTLSPSFDFALAALDADGDGAMDLAVAARGTAIPGLHYYPKLNGYLVLLRQSGSATFEERRLVDARIVFDVVTGDFNGDHLADLISDDSVFLGNGDATFTRHQPPRYAYHVEVGDLNRDGISDIITDTDDLVYLGTPKGFVRMGEYVAEKWFVKFARRSRDGSPSIVSPFNGTVTVIETSCGQRPRP